MQLQLLYTNYTTPQLQLHYTTATTTAAQHHTTSSSCGWCPLQPLHPFQQTQLQPPFNPSMDSLCHPWFTATNLSYRFPIFETSAAALCGTTGKRFELYIRHYILCIYIYIYISLNIIEGSLEVKTGVGKCPVLGILNITFKYLLVIISPIVGWCSIRTFTNPCKIPTVWTDGKAEVGRVRKEKRREEERRSEKRKSQKKEDAGARKGRKAAKHGVFPNDLWLRRVEKWAR